MHSRVTSEPLSNAPAAELAVASRLRAADLLELAKPRIAALVLITTAVGYLLAAGDSIGLVPLLHALAGTALAAAGANALNQVLERDLDARMHRTCDRPIPSGRLTASDAAVFGLISAVAGVGYLAATLNTLTAAVAAATIGSYVLLYTPLKRRTPWCTVVGAVPGALPPVIGWTAARGSLDVPVLTLFAILFVWQIPHFWSIAWLYRDDYRRAGFPMLPVIDVDGSRTARQTIGLIAFLIPVSLVPAWLGHAGSAYFGLALLLGAAFFAFGLLFARVRSRSSARQLMIVSILYLPLLLGLLVWDRTS